MSHRGLIFLDPLVQEINKVQIEFGIDPTAAFRIEEEMLLLGLGEREAVAITREAFNGAQFHQR